MDLDRTSPRVQQTPVSDTAGATAAAKVETYLQLATRENTRRSYASAIRHFEVEWGGLLPATTDSIVRYLADHGAVLSANTLALRLSSLARWHVDQGFADPTRHPMVRQVMRGIRTAHPVAERRAKPLQLSELESIDRQLEAEGRQAPDAAARLRALRDRSLLLTGFWRGFRGDELIHLRVENVELRPGEGMVCYLPRSKTDRETRGRHFTAPALSRLCPVKAYMDWIEASGLEAGPVYCAIDRWGRVSQEPLHANSLIPLIRSIFERTGTATPEAYSSHSLRRGFANWAAENGWDVKNLMEYVGWRDVKTAMRYVEASVSAVRQQIEQGLQRGSVIAGVPAAVPSVPPDPAPSAVETARLELKLILSSFSGSARRVTTARRRIEQWCLQGYAMRRLEKDGSRYEIRVPPTEEESLDDTSHRLLDEMHRIADDQECSLEASLREQTTGRHWS